MVLDCQQLALQSRKLTVMVSQLSLYGLEVFEQEIVGYIILCHHDFNADAMRVSLTQHRNMDSVLVLVYPGHIARAVARSLRGTDD